MKMKYMIILLAFILSANLNATDIKVGAKGEKHFELNEKVGIPQLLFSSKAPLEDIEGNVESSMIVSEVKLNPSNLEMSMGKISFAVDGMKTGINTRDEHLRSAMWLDAEKYANITFELKNIKNVQINSSGTGKSSINASAVGVFHMHGKMKNITVPITLTYLKESASSKKKAKGDLFFVEGTFKIALGDFAVAGKKGIVGSKVGEQITITMKLFYSEK